jgi:hypothetical protein
MNDRNGNSRGTAVAVNTLHAGLGNRLRVTLAVKTLAQTMGRDFAYVWPAGRDFGARMDELWDVPGAIRSNDPLLRGVRIDDVAVDGVLDPQTHQADAVWAIRSNGLLRTPDGLIDWGPELRALTPRPTVTELVGQAVRRLPVDEFVGVSVRAHPVWTHTITKQVSPVGWFIERLDALRREHPDVGIFLSCDDPATEGMLCARYPNVVAVEGKGPYNSASALVGAVADLYVLAASTRIIAPYWSSFAKVAWFLSDCAQLYETSRSWFQGKSSTAPAVADLLRQR